MLSVLTSHALFALLAAAFWGVGDFSGGMGVKSAGASLWAAVRVILLAHGLSLLVLLLLIGGLHQTLVYGAPLAWGLGAGVVAALSLLAFYMALAKGGMGVSAAISGLLAAAIPAVVSAVAEGRPSGRHLLGFGVAALAIWLIAAGENAGEAVSTTLLALGGGIGFGVYFVALRFANPAGVLWPMALARTGSVVTCGVLLAAIALRGEHAGKPVVNSRTLGWIAATAVFDTGGNLLFIAATRAGRLDVAAVLASLYPASTILLAARVLHERPTPRQVGGMTVALVAILLITL